MASLAGTSIHAASRSVGGIQYLNCGDWVENRTAITDSGDGRTRRLSAGSTSCATGSRRNANASPAGEPLSICEILVATDAWHPQLNGVVRTCQAAGQRSARAQGADVDILSASEFRSLPRPAYRSIRLAIPNRKRANE